MAKTKSFDIHTNEYDNWFIKNKYIYQSELNAVKYFTPSRKVGLEIGAGTGRFAVSLNIQFGLDPSDQMIKVAKSRGLKVFKGIAEQLPIKDEIIDFALMITTVCFVDDLSQSFKEVKRILKPDGSFIIGFVDKNSTLGKEYQKKRKKSKFYGDAAFYSIGKIMKCLKTTGFLDCEIIQTVFEKQNKSIQPFRAGYGEGSFVVIKIKNFKEGKK